VDLIGDKIAIHHFEIDYDRKCGSLMLRNLNLDTKESCGLYKMLLQNEGFNLQPGTAFRIGSLEFVVERFNHGIISDIGHRENQEDSYKVVSQLINFDNKVQISYFGVFDGHGGSLCAQFCSENLHLEIKT
jgi:hypothetical protein